MIEIIEELRSLHAAERGGHVAHYLTGAIDYHHRLFVVFP
jgi:flagellin-specific chaperone FliS